jgi:hypothetical protein
LEKTVNFIITITKTLHLAKILLYTVRNFPVSSQRLHKGFDSQDLPSAVNSESKTVNMVNVALFSCSSIGVAVGQLAVLPTGGRFASSSFQEILGNKRYRYVFCSCTMAALAAIV